MPTLRDIKGRIFGVQKTQTITRALKMVAAVKLRRAQQAIVQARPYALHLAEMMGHIASKVDHSLHPLLAVREPNRVCYVIVTADQGLCGSFNQNIIRKADAELAKYPDKQAIDLILIGRKGRDYFTRRNYKVIGEYVQFFKNLQFSQAVDIATLIRERYVDQQLDRIYLIYNEFKSAAQQRVVVEQLLPIIPVIPEGEKYLAEFIFEPDPITILNTLCPKNLNVQIWRVLLESFASEMGARMTAMEYATENANKLIAELQMQFNKKRQEGITKEILEIISGSEALKA
ncbi:MAG: ATP synthase F1 subunit gamma [candidate division KSB1 bacterium]|nr:ATP synthase F1 subunit gamma [candidate division KSB1 bacterium]MDZ7334402.1 ATP synthase F1 subunit gamma [candidate division KSB1 bacterium]MDZ7358175.1 ATP synthase F1 subunit gamma [candidate division KSB1 bacterium]MDZ7398791.1 ATP synthase F1 subunit gamma [candidate division KSB1 bacterium]